MTILSRNLQKNNFRGLVCHIYKKEKGLPTILLPVSDQGLAFAAEIPLIPMTIFAKMRKDGMECVFHMSK